ncbi:phosphopantetheine-containing protein [Mycobacterium sp. MS1601]|uniref:acyl carrier protein n=1 Tax=Mycobacterium sp. MS1601 TaxID=1936029 RepID=UPI00097916B8|nr:acyl carrier protein [Mycobacterium sp. MS1601]AQA02542.1 phosphopantetheine-containing protein [Mycobacterium sp. MS1601]
MSSDHIVKIFCEVLDVREVRADSDFFDLGGDSLLATRVLSAIARDFGVELLYDDFVDDPSPEGVFARVAAVVP